MILIGHKGFKCKRESIGENFRYSKYRKYTQEDTQFEEVGHPYRLKLFL